jgi:hypothetical protein
LPKGLAERLRKYADEPGKQFAASEAVLDAAASGPDWLKHSEIAEIAQRAILRGADLGQYELRAYVVMPNHVHVLLHPLVPMPKLTSGIKGVSARHANLKLAAPAAISGRTNRSTIGFATRANLYAPKPTSKTIP